MKWLGKIKTNPRKRNKNKYYEFYRDHVHNTKDFFQLNEQIADLIKRGYREKYVANRPRPNSLNKRYPSNPWWFGIRSVFELVPKETR